MIAKRTRALNFSSGPAALPEEVLREIQEELLDVRGSGMSVLEHSHRGAVYEGIHEEMLSLFRSLMAVPESHEILLLQGGASQQFAQVPLCFLSKGVNAHFAVTGVWGDKAASEAGTLAALYGATVTREGAAPYISALRSLSLPNAGNAYVHFASNETIHGVQYDVGVPMPLADCKETNVVCDMSSDILSKPVDFSKFALVYAGAQKNIGPSGLVIVVVAKEMLARCRQDVPSIWRYDVIAKNRSLYNTPPTLSIEIARRVLAWVKREGGVLEMEKRSIQKSAHLYRIIDGSSGFYTCPVEASSRSRMNVVFRLPSEALEKEFTEGSKKLDMSGLSGHRSVGGMRASLYNAVPFTWVKTLAEYMDEFKRTKG
jgi:phosphoserine aminotransferase